MASFLSQRVTRIGLAVSLIALATLVIRIPNPATQGYINLGDAMLFIVALIFGWRVAGVAGALGSALADVLGGFLIWAPWTLLIKGCEGVIVGFIAGLGNSLSPSANLVVPLVAVLVGGIWMVSGYYLAGTIMFGPVAALTQIPGDLIQALVAGGVALPLSKIIKNILEKGDHGLHTH